MAKVIVLEGSDGSGKETQTKALVLALRAEGYKVVERSFPNYHSKNSTLVKKYLSGDFGEEAGDVNAYASSMFYAVDRVGGMLEDWGQYLKEDDNTILVFDRFTSANMIHQVSKTGFENMDFVNWIKYTEFQLLGLPEPDITFFLDMSIEASEFLRRGRSNKITGDDKQDIHERDKKHLVDSIKAGRYLSDYFPKWQSIKCDNGEDSIRSIESIANEIFEITKEAINEKE